MSMKIVRPDMLLKETLPITISALHGRHLGLCITKTGTVLPEVPTPMLLNGGYGYGWF
jgi:hypothetical protein